jgi:hypothetical protein
MNCDLDHPSVSDFSLIHRTFAHSRSIVDDKGGDIFFIHGCQKFLAIGNESDRIGCCVRKTVMFKICYPTPKAKSLKKVIIILEMTMCLCLVRVRGTRTISFVKSLLDLWSMEPDTCGSAASMIPGTMVSAQPQEFKCEASALYIISRIGKSSMPSGLCCLRYHGENKMWGMEIGKSDRATEVHPLKCPLQSISSWL